MGKGNLMKMFTVLTTLCALGSMQTVHAEQLAANDAAAAAATGSVSAPTGVGVSSTKEETIDTSPGVLDHVHVDYFGTYHGAAISNFWSPYAANNHGVTKPGPFGMLDFDSELNFDWMFTKSLGAGVVIPFQLYPVLGRGFDLGDVGVKLLERNTVDSDGLRIGTNLIVQLPTSDYDKGRGMDIGFKTTPSIRYSVPHSDFTIGSWTEAKWYLGSQAGKVVKLYANSYVAYSILPQLAVQMAYEIEGDHNHGAQGALQMYESDLQPGLVWSITKHIIVNPYLQFFVADQVDPDHIAFGATISATIL